MAKKKTKTKTSTRRGAAKKPAPRRKVAKPRSKPRVEPTPTIPAVRDVSHRVGPPMCTRATKDPRVVLDEARAHGFDAVVVIGVKGDSLYASVSNGNMVQIDMMMKNAWESFCEAAQGTQRQMLN